MTGHPSIFQVGRVDDDGVMLHAHGWGLGLCAAACACHKDPGTGQLVIAQDEAAGTLGLVSWWAFQPAGRPCGCCTPWTVDELAAILRDLADITTLPELAA